METRKDKRPIKQIFPESRDIIKYDFTLDGVDYFSFEDFANTSAERYFACMTLTHELNMRCTADFLRAHTEAVDNIINKQPIELTEIIRLNMQLKERLDLIGEVDIFYKLCSVVYFDATENPYRFDGKHGKLKAVKFMQSNELDFFLSQPIGKLLPFLRSLGSDLPDSLKMLSLINQKHLDSISIMLSEAQKNSEGFLTLLSQQKMP